MPPRPSRKGRMRLGPSETDAAARRLLAARTRQARQDAPDAIDEPTPVLLTEAEPEPAAGDAEVSTRSGRHMPTLVIVLAVVTVVCGCLAAWFGTQASNAHGGAAANSALTDPSTSSRVTAQVQAEIGRLFSYDYANPQPTLTAASQGLTGAAVAQYRPILAAVRQTALSKHLSVVTSVTDVGLEMLHAGTARVLVFATETDYRSSQQYGQQVTAMLAVNAVVTGNTWKISGIDTFTG